ncbi:hypothetical protein H0A71_06535 [Alcaligenaceae bacterium]|nr:hypothetical protein [Alcaligenaceae bacterium]
MVDVIPGTNNRAIREVIDGLERFTPIISFGGASLEKQEQIEALLGQSVSLLTLIGLNYFLATGADALWYDPSDFSTLFQDADGTIPVTAVEQPVGLMLGKDKGLVRGPELVFIANWNKYNTSNGTISTSGETITVTSTNGSFGAIQDIAASGPKLLEVSFNINSMLTGGQNITVYEVGGFTVPLAPAITAAIGKQKFVVNGSNGVRLYIRSPDTGQSVSVSDFSVREIPGTHAYQETSTARPILKQDEYGRYYLQPDGTDDQYLLSKPIDLNSGLIGWAGSTPTKSGALLAAGASSGYLSGSTSGWSRDNGGTIPVGLAGKARQSVLAITNGTTNTQFKDSVSGTASVTALSTGLGAIDTLLKNPIDSRFYGLIARAGPSTPAEQALVLRYLDSLLGEVSP